MLSNLSKTANISAGKLEEVKAMQNDLPVVDNLKLRGTMCATILMEHAIELLKTKPFDEVKNTVLEMGTRLIHQGYVINNFNQLLLEKLTAHRLSTSNIKDTIKTKFCCDITTQKSLKSFSDPSLSTSATAIVAGTETLKTNELLNATAEIFLQDVMTTLTNNFDLPTSLIAPLK